MTDTPVIEETFQALYRALDETPEETRMKFLAKLVLILSNDLGDAPTVLAAIARAQRNP